MNSITVNEGSPYGVFTVTANIGETVTLALGNGSATNNTSNSSATDGSVDFGPTLEYSTDGGNHWTTYSAGFTVPGSGTGSTSILVRTSIINDTVYENAQSFTLTAGYTSGVTRSTDGTATIHDDGTGQWFSGTSGTGSNTAPSGHVLDDDRSTSLTIGDATANEGDVLNFPVTLSAPTGSAWHVRFTPVAGTAGPADYRGMAVTYTDSNGTHVLTPDVHGYYTVPAGVTSLNVAINALTDNLNEGRESFSLTASPQESYINSPGSGTGNIDDVYTAPPPVRPVQPPAPPAPPPAPAVPPPAPAVEPAPAPRADVSVIAGKSDFSRPPESGADKGAPPVLQKLDAREADSNKRDGETDVQLKNTLTPPDLVASPGVEAEHHLPQGTFSGGKGSINLVATQKDGSPLPAWVKFDGATGKFIVKAPAGAPKVIEIKVTARDSRGEKAEARMKIRTAADRVSLNGKPSLSDQLVRAIRKVV